VESSRENPRKALAQAALIAGAYAVITWALAPISFGPIQFRVSEILKPFALRKKYFVPALAVGLLLANMFSPNSSIWELAYMPVMCLIGGAIAWWLRNVKVVSLLFFSLWISGAVGFMLSVNLKLPFMALFPGIAVSEVILFFVGDKVVDVIMKKTGN